MTKVKDGIQGLTRVTAVETKAQEVEKKTDPGSQQGQLHAEKTGTTVASTIYEDQRIYRYTRCLSAALNSKAQPRTLSS